MHQSELTKTFLKPDDVARKLIIQGIIDSLDLYPWEISFLREIGNIHKQSTTEASSKSQNKLEYEQMEFFKKECHEKEYLKKEFYRMEMIND